MDEVALFSCKLLLLWRWRTTVYVLDPPNEDDTGQRKPPEHYNERVSEKTGQREWKIINPREFERRTLLAYESELLKWAGQFHTASERDILLAPGRHRPTVPNVELETRKTRTTAYRGHSWPLFPELGRRSLKVFTGVEDDLLATISSGPAQMRQASESIKERFAQPRTDHESSYESLSPDGTCMIVEGID